MLQGLAEHSDAVGDLAVAAGRRLGLDPGALVDLEFAARLHDVGKLAIPEAIVNKEGPLDGMSGRSCARTPRPAPICCA